MLVLGCVAHLAPDLLAPAREPHTEALRSSGGDSAQKRLYVINQLHHTYAFLNRPLASRAGLRLRCWRRASTIDSPVDGTDRKPRMYRRSLMDLSRRECRSACFALPT